MKCPYCKVDDQNHVLITRSREWFIKRIRECLACKKRFATIEINKITDEAYKSLSISKKRLKERN